MTSPDDRPTEHPDDHDGAEHHDVNLQPGPRDEGGAGGMATREQQAREEEDGG